MDKIREEFEKPVNWDKWPISWKRLYAKGRASRDEEIKQSRDALVYARKFISYIDYPNVVEIITKALKESE